MWQLFGCIRIGSIHHVLSPLQSLLIGASGSTAEGSGGGGPIPGLDGAVAGGFSFPPGDLTEGGVNLPAGDNITGSGNTYVGGGDSCTAGATNVTVEINGAVCN